jgi:hypothetical protein
MRIIVIFLNLFLSILSFGQTIPINPPIPATSGDAGIQIVNQYYKHSINPQMAISGCVDKNLLQQGYSKATFMAVTNNLQGNLNGLSRNSFITLIADIEQPRVISLIGYSNNTELTPDFIPEDIAMINYNQGAQVFAVVVGKFLNSNGYSIAYQVFRLQVNLPLLNFASVNSAPTNIEFLRVSYDLNSDDLVRIDDDGNSKFTIVYTRNGEIHGVTGHLDPTMPDGALVSNPVKVFPNSIINSGSFQSPDVAMLPYDIDPNIKMQKFQYHAFKHQVELAVA